MKFEWLNLSIIQWQSLMRREEGQDLMEYAVPDASALIALAAISLA